MIMVSKEITKELIEYCKENEWWEVETKYLIEDLEKILKDLERLETIEKSLDIIAEKVNLKVKDIIELTYRVLKNLEILEILKKEPYLSLNDYYKGNENDFNFYLKNIREPKITREEYFKVKEWLENDK